jgi:hypothetical protein
MQTAGLSNRENKAGPPPIEKTNPPDRENKAGLKAKSDRRIVVDNAVPAGHAG